VTKVELFIIIRLYFYSVHSYRKLMMIITHDDEEKTKATLFLKL